MKIMRGAGIALLFVLLVACGSTPQAQQPQIRTIIATPTPLAQPIVEATPMIDHEGWRVNLTVHNVQFEEYQVSWYPMQQSKWITYGPRVDVRLIITWRDHPNWKYDNHWVLKQTDKHTD